MRITISGPIGSGKSTVGRRLAERLNFNFFSGGTFFRELAKKHNMSLEDFNVYAEEHPEIDKQQDQLILDFLKDHDNVVVESRLSGWLCHKNGVDAFKIFIGASREERIRRVSGRESSSYENTARDLIRREESEIKRYKELYGIDYKITDIYDYVIDTDNISAEDVVLDIYDKVSNRNKC